MSIASSPEFRQLQRTRPLPSPIEAAPDVLRTLLVLALIGTGVVILRFLLILARAVIGH